MVDLPIPQTPLVTANPPASRVGGDVFASPQRSSPVQGWDQLASGLEDVATRLAQQQGQEDAKQLVTLDENGQPQVQTPQTAPVILGRAGQAYDQALAAGIEPAQRVAISSTVTDMRQKQDLDPNAETADWQKKIADFANGYIAKNPGPLGQAGFNQIIQLGNQHYADLTNKDTKYELANSQAAIQADLTNAQNELFSNYRQGGKDTPQSQQALRVWQDAQQKLSDNAELFGLSKAEIADKKAKTEIDLVGQAAIGAIDRAVANKDPNDPYAGIVGAQKIVKDQITNNPELNKLSYGERARLEAMATARVDYNKEENKQEIAATRRDAVDVLAAYGRGRPVDDETVINLRNKASLLGDVDAAGELDRARAAYRNGQPYMGLTSVPTADYLANLAGKENPSGSNTASPGTSSALGKFQFTAGTWDMLRQQHPELGLTADGRTDPAQQDKAVRAFTTENRASLQRAGFDPNDKNTYMAHFLGAGGAQVFLSAMRQNPGAPAASLLPEAAAANQDVFYNKDGTQRSLSEVYALQTKNFSGSSTPITPVPFSPKQIQDNPGLLSAAIRQFEADKDTRISIAKQQAVGINSVLQSGRLPDDRQMATIVQMGQQYPKEFGQTSADLQTKYSAAVDATATAQMPAQQGNARMQAVQDYATNNPDIMTVEYAKTHKAMFDAQRKMQSDEPQRYAALKDVGWRQQPPAPLTPDNSQAFAAQIADRVGGATRIAPTLGVTPESIIFGKQDIADIGNYLQRADGPHAAAALQQLTSGLTTDAANELWTNKELSAIPIAMSKSTDPDKFRAGFTAMDTQYRRNPAQFDLQFPHESARLFDYQNRLSYFTNDEIAKQQAKASDPSQRTAQEAAEKVAKERLSTVTAEQVTSKFGNNIPVIRSLFGPSTPPDFDSAKGAMLADYKMLYAEGFKLNQDESLADKFAMEKLGNKYSPSEVNDNRVMAYAPEKSFPQVDGSHNWVRSQLTDFVTKNVAPTQGSPGMSLPGADDFAPGAPGAERYYPRTTAEQTAYAKLYAPRMLFADQDTQAAIFNHQPPTYAVIVTDPSNRVIPLMDKDLKPLRFTPDYQRALAEQNAAMAAKQAPAARSNILSNELAADATRGGG